jgi:2'-5' RNA ligase
MSSSKFTRNKVFSKTNSKSSPKPRPSHFVALRIKNDSIWSKVDEFQNNILSKHPDVKPFKIDSTEFHITLFVCSIPKEKITIATKCLATCVQHSDLLEKIQIQGFDTFGDKVVYASISNEQPIRKFQNLVKEEFLKYEINVPNESFNPHATLFKVRRDKSSSSMPTNLPIESFEEYKEFYFGEFQFDHLELNRMIKSNGYYEIESQVDF